MKTSRISPSRATRARLTAIAFALGLMFAGQTCAMENLKILAPAAPGGGWDQTARALQAAMQSAKLVNKVTVDNRGGAGGTIGLAYFVNTHKGDPNALLVGGMVMVGAIETHKSPVKLS